ncbi:MAG TPA: hypothetical protein VG844_08205 [Terracidiphilus sp.]|nr:hypothetical protein [Terracidiphilus sp.]
MTEIHDQQASLARTCGEESAYRTTRLIFWISCLSFALFEAWSGAHFTNPDGIAYLDMSDAFLRHDWHLLINSLWSPLYPFLIGIATWLIRPSSNLELPIVHAVNFVIFVGLVAAFDLLLQKAIVIFSPAQDGIGRAHEPSRYAWKYQLLGYSLFFWSTFVLISGLRMVCPDQCVAMFVFLDAALLLDVYSGKATMRTFALLGVTLGLGYYAKAILFPMAFIFLGVAWFAAPKKQRTVPRILTAFLVFIAVSAPLSVCISRMAGKPSFSEAGSLNYAWHVDGFPPTPFYSTNRPAYLKHPMKLLHGSPAVFAFDGPAPSTYTPYLYSAYWNSGVTAKFDLKKQWKEIRRNVMGFFSMPLASIWIWIAGVVFLLALNKQSLTFKTKKILQTWPLLIPGVTAWGLYMAVHVESRYLGPFILLVFLGLLPAALSQKPEDAHRNRILIPALLSAIVMAMSIVFIVHRAATLPVVWAKKQFDRTAQSLTQMGIHSGDKVAIIGYGSDDMIWARRDRLQIIAQISPTDANEFWLADSKQQSEVYDAVAKAGAIAIVTDAVPDTKRSPDWIRLGNTRSYIRFIGPLPSSK